MQVSRLAYSSRLKMETIRSSETSVDLHRTTRRYIPEDATLHYHRRENLKSNKAATYLLIFTMCPSSTPLSFMDWSASLVQIDWPRMFSSRICLHFSTGPPENSEGWDRSYSWWPVALPRKGTSTEI
jgi:hypothetical protein